MTADHDARAVLARFGLTGEAIQSLAPLQNAGGWSGSLLWRVSTADGRDLCLRRWPSSRQDSQRLLFIHGVLQTVWDRGLTIVPLPLQTASGETLIAHPAWTPASVHADHFWELAPWLPGAADFHARPTRERLRAAMHALASFHLLAVHSPLAPGVSPDRQLVRRGAAPALFVRSGTLRKFDERRARLAAAVCNGLGNELDTRAARQLSLLPLPAARLAPQLAAVADQPLQLQPVIRDIWHDHVLFTGDAVSGIVDFGALDIDTPLTDIARLVGSLVADDCEARTFACDAYSELRPLTDQDRRLIDLLDASGQVIAAINWLTWLYVDRRDMGPLPPILQRLDATANRLAGLNL
jgi:homoserine kinase type II